MTLELSERIASDDFAQSARHPDFPQAFTRNRKLPLPALIASLLSTRNHSQQTMLDSFFASVCGTEGLHREVSDRAFAKAREHLHQPALVSLNDLVIRRADEAGLIERWCALRVVAADASLLMPAVRPCLLSRSAAAPEQRLFALYLPSSELTCLEQASGDQPTVWKSELLPSGQVGEIVAVAQNVAQKKLVHAAMLSQGNDLVRAHVGHMGRVH